MDMVLYHLFKQISEHQELHLLELDTLVHTEHTVELGEVMELELTQVHGEVMELELGEDIQVHGEPELILELQELHLLELTVLVHTEHTVDGEDMELEHTELEDGEDTQVLNGEDMEQVYMEEQVDGEDTQVMDGHMVELL